MPEVSVDSGGNATFSIPLEVPDGTGGLTPGLSLSYNSGGGNGLLGKGWSLSGLSFLKRDPSFGLKYDSSDHFESSDHGQLISSAGQNSVLYSKEESFFGFYPQGDFGLGPTEFIAFDKTGKRYTYGGTEASALTSSGSVRVWGLSEVREPHGETINYDWEVIRGELYLKKISYAGGKREVIFEYESRNDFIRNYYEKQLVIRDLRLNKIRFYSEGSHVHSYELTYLEQSITKSSLLTKIQFEKDNFFSLSTHQPLEFSYSQSHEGVLPRLASGAVTLSGGYGEEKDFGDRMIEFLKQVLYAAYSSKLENGNQGGFNAPWRGKGINHATSSAVIGGGLTAGTDSTATMNLVPRYNDQTEFIARYPLGNDNRDACHWGALACWAWAAGVKLVEVKLACTKFLFFNIDGCNNGMNTPEKISFATDFDGDGISEYSRFSGFMDNDNISIRTDDLKNNRSFVSPTFPIKYNTYYALGDIDGDTKSDFVFEKAGMLHVSFSNGSGLDSPVVFSNVLLNPYAQNYTLSENYIPRDYLVDINRDGRTDFLHFADDRISVYLSQGRSFQAEKIVWIGGNRNPKQETVQTDPFRIHRMNQFSDVDGDGIPEHVFIANINQPSEQSQLAELTARHLLEMNAAKAERQAIIDEILLVIGGKSVTEEVKTNLSLKVFLDDRPLYWTLVEAPGTATTEEKELLEKSIDKQFSEDVLNEMFARHNSEYNAEISKIRNVNLSGASYQIIVSKINLANGTMTQSLMDLPQSIVGYMGKNWLVDVNGDGLPDLVSFVNRNSHFNPFDYGVEDANTFYNEVKVVLNVGGKFDTSNIISNYIGTVVRPDRFAKGEDDNKKYTASYDFADVNEDGKIDFIVKEFRTNNFHIYFGDGNGQFSNRTQFAVDAEDISSAQFEDRNEDGILDFYYQYGKNSVTRQILSNTPQALGGLITKMINHIPGSETTIEYSWKKNIPGAVVKGGGNYNTSLPNLYPTMLVTKVSSVLGLGFPIEKTEYSYYNSRYKPGDIETSFNYGFESISERSFVAGVPRFKVVTNYLQNPNFPGYIGSIETFTGSDQLISMESLGYSIYQPHVGTKLRLQTSRSKNMYENGQLKDQVVSNTVYDSSHAYEPSIIEEDFNGRMTRSEISYGSNLAMQVLTQPIESKKTVNGTLVEHKKWTYTGVDLASESKLVGAGAWYSIFYSYDSLGNVASTTDSLGRTLSYEHGDVTRSKPTLTRNALGQTNKTTYDQKFDVELSMEDPNGNLTTYEYDEYGRKTFTYLDGNKVESIEYGFDGTLFTTKQTTHTDEGDVWTKEYKNLAGNVLKKESLVVEGIVSTTESVYDSLGRETQKSNSYFTGESPAWSYTFYYNQSEDSQERLKETIAATGEISRLVYGLRSTAVTTTNQSEVIRTETQNQDNWGRLTTKTSQGESMSYQYDNADRMTRIIDPGNGITEISYDIGGKKVRYSDSNSGTIIYTYNVAGDLLTQTDARGIVIRKEVDGLGRITKVYPGNETPVVYEYDAGNSVSSTNVIGKLTKVTDESGVTELAYDRKGNVVGEKRTIDDLQVLFQRTYDPFGRVKTITYPEGTLVRNHYTGTGQLAFLTMDSHDGNSLNHTVVSYEGPKVEDNKYYIERKTGNGIKTKIGYDPLRMRPQSLVTYLKDSSVEQSMKYEYDKRGNISAITDLINESRNQSFEYDHLNRVTKAIGKYGEENYNYHRNGNLLNKGAFTYSYDNGNHIHAVTRVNSPNTGIVGYTYDSMGNMTTRNGDTLVYNAQNKLKRIETDGGDQFDYTYDHSGMRIKKALQNSNTTTYSFGNFYEIHRSPGQQEKHTLYVIGVEGDMVAQYSRPDAILLNQMASNSWMVNPFCKDVNIDCNTYWKNRTNFALLSFLEDTNLYIDGKIREGHRALPWVVLLGLLFWVVFKTKESSSETDSDGGPSNDIFGISILPNFTNYFQKQIPRYGTALLVVVFSFTTTAGCFPLLLGGAEGESGTPIWLIGLGNGIPSDTPSVADEPGQGGSGGGGSSSGNARVSGMYFFHPDHLGSITMITDGNGNVLAGGERGGKSHITYKPYGEILRTDSYGPDITKFKYTGQEEDKESGLYYYKARYYDASLGRFASNDGMVFPDKEQGMNRMMYVEGNPISWRDQTGNSTNYMHMLNQMVLHAVFGAAKIASQQIRSLGRGLDYAGRKAGRGIDGGARWLASGGNYSRNKGNDLDNLLSTGSFFESIQKSDLASWVSKQYNDMRRKPSEAGQRRNLRKANDAHDRRAIACAAYFGFNTPGYKDCYIQSEGQRLRERNNIRRNNYWSETDKAQAENTAIEIATIQLQCAVGANALIISTSLCPSKEELKKQAEQGTNAQ
ncbi:RHS repeat-associated core domain-containing protein [Leptospira brenneri]|uniref:RHS repeat-associated core domain-containing protein n=1 Tax=Leptospira brenneri TaxID=2023182 RepID=UPI0013FD563A|nr:RHS repeat-associated core domain-containing protein [Leptospira brenneri]